MRHAFYCKSYRILQIIVSRHPDLVQQNTEHMQLSLFDCFLLCSTMEDLDSNIWLNTLCNGTAAQQTGDFIRLRSLIIDINEHIAAQPQMFADNLLIDKLTALKTAIIPPYQHKLLAYYAPYPICIKIYAIFVVRLYQIISLPHRRYYGERCKKNAYLPMTYYPIVI